MQAGTGLQPRVSSLTTERTPEPGSLLSFAEGWLRARERWIALLLAAAFLLRIQSAGGTFLNADEALHFSVANQHSFLEAYRASFTISHPPLLIFTLYFWRALGTSEVVLRLPSILAGTAFCWILFQWAAKLFGRAAGWTAFILAGFLPPMIAVSSEIRQYALLLLFGVCAAC